MRRFALRNNRQAGDIVALDAAALTHSHGNGAYEEARTRAREERQAKVIDGNRPPGHWDKVRLEIAKRTGRKIGTDTASRYPDA